MNKASTRCALSSTNSCTASFSSGCQLRFPQYTGRSDVAAGQFGTKGFEERPVLRVDRTDPAEPLVVLGDASQPLGGHPSSAGDVLEERKHVVRPLRTTKRNEKQRVVVGHCCSPVA